jgi:hypothetical protein
MGGVHTMVSGDSPDQQDGRCGCGSENKPREAEVLGESGRSQLPGVSPTRQDEFH